MNILHRLARDLLHSVLSWFDNSLSQTVKGDDHAPHGVHWARVVPFIILHVACFGVIWVGWSPVAVAVCLGLYLVRMFFITAFYHRYFSHRTYKTSRPAQFAFAVLGNTCVQRGPLWWAAHHRQHHRTSDREGDPHSPHRYSLYWSHMGWITARQNFEADLRLVPDLMKFRELRWLDRFDTLVPIAFATVLFLFGSWLGVAFPELGTSGGQMLIWGFFISTVLLFHGSVLINSAAHRFGRKRFETKDESRNSLLLAIVTLGEGWHNNHHRYPNSTRQGFFWWEIDISYYVLKVMSWIGLVWDLRPVPEHVMQEARALSR